jgi:hypothetical protein
MKVSQYYILFFGILALNSYLKGESAFYRDSILLSSLINRAYELEFTCSDSAILLYHEAGLQL